MALYDWLQKGTGSNFRVLLESLAGLGVFDSAFAAALTARAFAQQSAADAESMAKDISARLLQGTQREPLKKRKKEATGDLFS